jgi:ABC-2 type transport system ATP-binding protein
VTFNTVHRSIQEEGTVSPIVLQAVNLDKKFGDLLAVQDLSLEVLDGEVFGLLGPNGAGKTTTINMMAGLLMPDRGQVRICGEVIRGAKAEQHSRIGVCPQETVLWERLTCFEQLHFIGQMYDIPTKISAERSEQLLIDLDLIEKKDRLAGTLSGGMKRRLNFAMALVHDPEIIILDEPEAGLDPQSRVKVREYIKGLAREKTIILTTHNMDEAERLADRVAIIDHGQLLVLDTPEALKRTVGEGDVVEISFLNQVLAQSILGRLDDRATYVITGDRLHIQGLNLVNLLPTILEQLRSIDLDPDEIRLRGNTLEDVFIQLTGRGLRE